MKLQTTSHAVHFLQAALLKPVIHYFETIGVPTEKYLLKVGIQPRVLEDQASLIPLSLAFKFIDTVCIGENIEDVGLLAGQATSLQMLGDFGHFLLDAKSVRDYLSRGCRFISIASSGDYFWLSEEGDQLRFCASISHLNADHTIQNYLYILLITINTIRQATEGSWVPTEIIVPGMNAITAGKLQAWLPGATILRKGNYASFLIPQEILQQPMGAGAEPLAPESALSRDFVGSIDRLIKFLIISGDPDIQSAADVAGFSTRTLQRKLKEHGTSYTELSVQARVDLAKQWIRTGDRSVAEIARTLGYGDPTNFSRAFRRITGLSPRAHRRQVT